MSHCQLFIRVNATVSRLLQANPLYMSAVYMFNVYISVAVGTFGRFRNTKVKLTEREI